MPRDESSVVVLPFILGGFIAGLVIMATHLEKQKIEITELKAQVEVLTDQCINKAKPSPVQFEVDAYASKNSFNKEVN